jgi:hypothetical protein
MINEDLIKQLYEHIEHHQSGLLMDHELLQFCASLKPVEPESGYLDPATGLRC